tara:strand:- start:1730 stop:1894 length:165 start_codon:yes stop_codon:yes gene_type:complete
VVSAAAELPVAEASWVLVEAVTVPALAGAAVAMAVARVRPSIYDLQAADPYASY